MLEKLGDGRTRACKSYRPERGGWRGKGSRSKKDEGSVGGRAAATGGAKPS